MAAATAAAGLREMGYLFHRGQIVGAHHILDQHRINGEALANHRAFLVVVDPRLAAIVSHGGLQRLAPHHRAMHLLGRQAIEIVGNLLVGDLQGFVQRHALDDLGQRRRRGDGRTAAEGLEMRIQNALGFGIDLEHQAQRVAALDRTDVPDGIGAVQGTGVTRIEEMLTDFFGVIPHDAAPLILVDSQDGGPGRHGPYFCDYACTGNAA